MRRGGHAEGRREEKKKLPLIVRILIGFLLFLFWFVPIGVRIWDRNDGVR